MAEKGQHLTLPQAAALLGVSERQIGKLREQGFISTDGPGRYTLVNLIRGAIAYYEDKAEQARRNAQANRATEARTAEIELRIKRKMANLIEASAPAEIMDEFVAAAAQELRTIPGRLYPDRKRRSQLRDEINHSIARIEKLTAAAKAALIDGKP
jgi:signal transduction histidine kinase